MVSHITNQVALGDVSGSIYVGTIENNGSETAFVQIQQPSTDPIAILQFETDGSLIGGDTSGTIFQWREHADISINESADLGSYTRTPIAIDADRKMLALGKLNGDVELWNLSEGRLVYVLESNDPSVRVISVAFSPGGTHFGAIYADRSVIIWTLPSAKFYASIRLDGHDARIQQLYWEEDEETIYSAGYELLAWDMQSYLSTTYIASVGNTRLTSFAFSNDGRYLAYGQWDPGPPIGAATVILRDRELNTSKTILQGGNSSILSLSFSTDGEVLATAGWQDDLIHLWSISANSELPSIFGLDINKIEFLSSKLLVVLSGDQVQFWDIESAQMINQVDGIEFITSNAKDLIAIQSVQNGIVSIYSTNPLVQLYQLQANGVYNISGVNGVSSEE